MELTTFNSSAAAAASNNEALSPELFFSRVTVLIARTGRQRFSSPTGQWPWLTHSKPPPAHQPANLASPTPAASARNAKNWLNN
jgi:hypothetical protein